MVLLRKCCCYCTCITVKLDFIWDCIEVVDPLIPGDQMLSCNRSDPRAGEGY